MKQLGIVIITYQSERYMAPLLESLAATIDRDQCVIWILDNASDDETVAAIEREQKRLGLPLRLLPGTENIGYIRGVNRAFAALRRETPCDTVVLLNPDTVVHPGWWQPLVAELKDRKAGSASSLLLLPDGTINSRGNALHFLGLGFVQGYGEPVSALPEKPELFSGSGAVLAFRVATLDAMNAQFGLSDVLWEELFFYADDTDFGWRLRLAGFDNRLVVASRVTHDHQFWLHPPATSRKRLFYIERNRFLLMLANFKWATLLLLLPWLLASEIALALGVWKLYPRRLKLWRAVFDETRRSRFWERRRRLQRGRCVSDRAILSAMTGTVRHGALPFGPWDRLIDGFLRGSHRLLCAVIKW